MNEQPNNSGDSFAGQATTRTDATVRAALAHAVDVGQLTSAQSESVFWFHSFGLEHRLSNAELGEKIGMSKGTVSQIFSGKYLAADWTNIVRSIDAFRKIEEREIRRLPTGFIKTSTSETIFLACDNALKDRMPCFLYGSSQLGKTTALEEYRRLNGPIVKYLRCRDGMTLNRFARLLGELCHLRNLRDKTNGDLLDEVAASLNSSTLLIFDEFHLCLETVSDQTSKRLIEYIREIYDLSHCGLVLCGTKVGLTGLEEGRNSCLFDQLRRRGIVKVVLPDSPPVRDLNAFARSYGLPPPSGADLSAVKQLVKSRGLGVYSAYLAKAASLVANLNAKNPEENAVLDWSFFMRVKNGFENLSRISNEY